MLKGSIRSHKKKYTHNNRLLKIFHWCMHKEQQILSYLDKTQYKIVIYLLEYTLNKHIIVYAPFLLYFFIEGNIYDIEEVLS